jgi:hypothetical protein
VLARRFAKRACAVGREINSPGALGHARLIRALRGYARGRFAVRCVGVAVQGSSGHGCFG